MAAPIPLVPPVTNATRPSSLSPARSTRSCVAVIAFPSITARLTVPGAGAGTGAAPRTGARHGRSILRDNRHSQRSGTRANLPVGREWRPTRLLRGSTDGGSRRATARAHRRGLDGQPRVRLSAATGGTARGALRVRPRAARAGTTRLPRGVGAPTRPY